MEKKQRGLRKTWKRNVENDTTLLLPRVRGIEDNYDDDDVMMVLMMMLMMMMMMLMMMMEIYGR